jgi:excisionase family DNA binding protein
VSDAGERARCCLLEHLADLLGVPREAIPPHAGPLPLFLTSQEAAVVLRTTHRTVLEECRRGSLPAIKVGGDWKVSHVFILAAAVGISLPRAAPRNTSKTDIKEYLGRDSDQESDIIP